MEGEANFNFWYDTKQNDIETYFNQEWCDNYIFKTNLFF
jgi:hypothetical protein